MGLVYGGVVGGTTSVGELVEHLDSTYCGSITMETSQIPVSIYASLFWCLYVCVCYVVLCVCVCMLRCVVCVCVCVCVCVSMYMCVVVVVFPAE